jgi:hypothetical protein
VSFSGGDAGFDWTSISPRLGLTYALGAERKTLLRASYSRFADQLGTGFATWTNPLALPGYAYFFSTQSTGPNGGPVNPALFVGGAGLSGNVDPRNGQLLNSNAVDSDFKAPTTDEVLFGVEHALLPEFVVGLNLTYRRLTDIAAADLLVFDGSTSFCDNSSGDPLDCPAFTGSNLNAVGRRAGRGDFVPFSRNQVLPDGSTRNITFYNLRDGVSTRGGQFLYNGDEEQEYKGASFVFNKRLANRWMLRGNFTWADWQWSKVSCEDPTLTLGGQASGVSRNGCVREGDPVLQGSGTGSGAKGGIYINSEWSYSVNGLYQIAPDRAWGFNAALNLTGRQGYPQPYFWLTPQTGAPGGVFARENYAQTSVQATSSQDEFRLDDIHMVDARLEKEFTFSDVGLTVGVDVFNVFNESYVLQRNHRLAQTTSDNVREITSPRIIRLGARLSFR